MHNPPKILPSFYKAHKHRQRMNDEQMWIMGQYAHSAVAVAVEHCLAGRKAQSKYVEKPFMMQAELNKKKETERLTEEQKRKQVEYLFMSLQIQGSNFKREQKKKAKQDGAVS